MFVWDKKYTIRQPHRYRLDNYRLTPESHRTLITAFLEERTTELDLPQYSHTALSTFLKQANRAVIQSDPTLPGHTQKVAWLDHRSDDSGWRDICGNLHSARNWDEYSTSPPQGVDCNTEILDIGQLYKRLLPTVGRKGILLMKQS